MEAMSQYDLLVIGSGPAYFLKSVFNYPTPAECYNVAALDCANRLG